MINEDEGFEKYGDVPLYFSHYYNFLFIYKSKVMETGDQITLQLGGNMEKVSAMVVKQVRNADAACINSGPMRSFFLLGGEQVMIGARSGLVFAPVDFCEPNS